MWPFTPSYPTVCAADIHDRTFDYIIVGGGTAGCVLASRLSETPNVSVLLLEKGQVRDNLLSRIPLLSQNFEFPFLQSVLRQSEPTPHANGRRAALWTAEGLGGATRINALLWTQGWPGDYNNWAENYGLDGWSWEKVEPYFKKSEEVLKPRKPVFELGCIPFVEEAARRVGLPVGPGVNDPGAGPQGCFVMDQTIDGTGQRVSAYKAWLPTQTARERKDRLKICVGVVASKLLFDKNGTRVVGVMLRQGDREYTVNARREVIVCGGAICSPQLLMLSGIGPRDHLESLGIPVIQDLKCVGYFWDHASVPIMMELPRKHTLHWLENVIVFLWHILLYLFFGKGLLANGTTSRSIFVHTSTIDEDTMTVRHDDEPVQDFVKAFRNGWPGNVPDVEIMINPVNCLTVNIPGKSLFTWYTTLLQPRSVGEVKLVSDDPIANPKITHPLIRYGADQKTTQKAVRFTMRLAEEFGKDAGYPHEASLVFAPGMDLEYLDSLYKPQKGFLQKFWSWKKKSRPADQQPVPVPGAAGQPSSASISNTSTNNKPKKEKPNWRTITSKEIGAYISRVCVSSLHISSTCRMSSHRGNGVVDQQLKVHGVENLRVADASVLPTIPSAHIMAPVVMVADRCAEFVKGEWEERKGR